MIRFGIPTLIEPDDPEQLCALCRRLGLSFVELNTNFPSHQLHLLDAQKLNALAERYGVGFTLHLSDEMPVADFNPLVAKGYRDAVLEAIEFARAIHAPVINMHISEGAHYTRPDGVVYFYQAYEKDYLSGMAAFRGACEKAIGSSGIRICMENSKAYFPFQKNALELLLESPVFALTLDIGHNHCSHYADEGWILERRDRLAHMHIHDAKGMQDHLPLGCGDMDLTHYLTLAQDQACTAVLEVKTAEGLRQSVSRLRETGYL